MADFQADIQAWGEAVAEWADKHFDPTPYARPDEPAIVILTLDRNGQHALPPQPNEDSAFHRAYSDAMVKAAPFPTMPESIVSEEPITIGVSSLHFNHATSG